MVDNKKNPPIIIAGINPPKKDYKDYIMSILRRGMYEDEIRLNVVDKYLPIAQEILRVLKKSAGWIEQDRKKVKAYNEVCFYSERGNCINEEVNFPGACNEAVKSTCAHYKRKYDIPFTVNQITIEKIGALKSL